MSKREVWLSLLVFSLFVGGIILINSTNVSAPAGLSPSAPSPPDTTSAPKFEQPIDAPPAPAPGLAAQPKVDGEACTAATECSSGQCTDGKCVPKQVPAAEPKKDGEACTAANECSSSQCTGGKCIAKIVAKPSRFRGAISNYRSRFGNAWNGFVGWIGQLFGGSRYGAAQDGNIGSSQGSGIGSDGEALGGAGAGTAGTKDALLTANPTTGFSGSGSLTGNATIAAAICKDPSGICIIFPRQNSTIILSQVSNITIKFTTAKETSCRYTKMLPGYAGLGSNFNFDEGEKFDQDVTVLSVKVHSVSLGVFGGEFKEENYGVFHELVAGNYIGYYQCKDKTGNITMAVHKFNLVNVSASNAADYANATGQDVVMGQEIASSSVCGDGVCDYDEDKKSCSQDCTSQQAAPQSSTTANISKIIAVGSIFISLAIFLGKLIITRVKKRKAASAISPVTSPIASYPTVADQQEAATEETSSRNSGQDFNSTSQ